MGFIILAGQLAYPLWLGTKKSGFGAVGIYIAVLTVCLIIGGPKSHQVAGNPGLGLRSLFSLVLAIAISLVGYGAGRLFAG